MNNYEQIIKQNITIYPNKTDFQTSRPNIHNVYEMKLNDNEDIYSRLLNCAETTKVSKEHFGNSDNPIWVKEALHDYFRHYQIAIIDEKTYFVQIY